MTNVISAAVSSPLSIASLTTGEPASGSSKSAVIVTTWPFVKTLSVSEYDKAPVGDVLSISKVAPDVGAAVITFPARLSSPTLNEAVRVAMSPAASTV